MLTSQERLEKMGHWMDIMETMGIAPQTPNTTSHQFSAVELGNPFRQPEGPPQIVKCTNYARKQQFNVTIKYFVTAQIATLQ